ncbi:unnamed protein product [Cunninghamella blakesleeana]
MANNRKNILKTRLDINSKYINAKFEGYKLQPFPESTSLIRTKLPFGELDVKRKGQRPNTRLGFRELQARVRFNHLAYGLSLNNHTGVSFFIDIDYCLTAAIFDKNTKTTRMESIVNLIQPASIPNYTEIDNNVPIYPEYPSIKALSHDLLVVSNGVGDIELIGIEQKDGSLLGATLSHVKYKGDGSEGIQPVPCVLLAARKIKSKVILVVYSQTSAKKTTFNITTLEMNIPISMDDTVELKTLHIQQGNEVPVYCAVTSDGEYCILGSETQYQQLKLSTSSSDKDDEGDIIMDNENKNDNNETTMENITPYQWVQDQAEIIMQFELPEGTPKSAISLKFTNDHLMLIIRAQEYEISYPYRKWWSTIKPDECTWTIESSGLLSLFITKQDDRTRWPQLFEMDDGILETVDKAKLAEIAQQLEKFTSDLSSSSSSKHEPFMQQHPAATDMDEDVDEPGQPIIFEIFNNQNGDCIQEINSSGKEWLSNAFDCSLYSHPQYQNDLLLPSVTCKMDVDGFVYNWSKNDKDQFLLHHTATFDAFGFIQASKRDTRFVRHDPTNQFITIVESNRNAYIYYNQSETSNLIKKQTLIDITEGHDVDILGVQMILDDVLFILTESEIIAIIV